MAKTIQLFLAITLMACGLVCASDLHSMPREARKRALEGAVCFPPSSSLPLDGIRVRKLNPGDQQEMAAHSAFLCKFYEGFGKSPTETESLLQAAVQHNSFRGAWGAFEGSDLRGHLLMQQQARNTVIETWGVDKEYHDRGIGSLLLSVALSEVRSARCFIQVPRRLACASAHALLLRLGAKAFSTTFCQAMNFPTIPLAGRDITYALETAVVRSTLQSRVDKKRAFPDPIK